MTCRTLIAVLALAALPSSLAAEIRSQIYVTGLSSPVGFAQDPSNPAVQFVLEQAGTVRVINHGVLLATPFLTIPSNGISSGGERGLLGIAFPPNYAATRRFYVNFTNASGHTVVARFLRSAGNPLVADYNSRCDLRWPNGERFIFQPASNHNGGHLAFGPDGFLYIGLGDGGGSNDPSRYAQNPDTLLGKMLRVDVSVGGCDPGYQVPSSNPFVDNIPLPALDEIWAFGLRNPWRYSFDDPARGGTGALVIGDVGQGAWEEIDYEPANAGGRNYGWCNREGAHNNSPCPSTGSGPPPPAPAYLPLTDPIHEYSHSFGSSITGGFVYRGSDLPARFVGRYFYADLTGRVWSVALAVNPTTGEATASGQEEHTAALGGFSRLGFISSFGTDSKGELYVVNYSAGAVIKIVGTSRPGRLTGDFGGAYGLWTLSYTAGWSQLHPLIAKSMVTGDLDANGIDETIIDFGNPHGLWVRLNNASWVQLHPLTANHMAVGDLDRNGQDDVIVDFPGYGIWVRYNNSFWLQLHVQQSSLIAVGNLDGAGGGDVMVNFPGQGIWVYRNNSAWSQLNQYNVDAIAAGDFDGNGRDDVALNFPGIGLYVWANDSTWSQLQTLNAPRLATGSLDQDARADLIADFAPSQGIWVLLNGTTWFQLHAVTSEQLLAGDVDQNGRDDIIVDFGAAYGTWVYFNLGGWGQVHHLSPGPTAFGYVR
jgi:glucose/arabinose dehydrogenase